jgi:hypothetical protein
MLLAKMLQQRWKLLKLFAFASVNEKCGTREATLARGVQLGKDRNQLDREIVDAIKAHILERVEDGAFSGAGEPGEDDELTRFVSIE